MACLAYVLVGTQQHSALVVEGHSHNRLVEDEPVTVCQTALGLLFGQRTCLVGHGADDADRLCAGLDDSLAAHVVPLFLSWVFAESAVALSRVGVPVFQLLNEVCKLRLVVSMYMREELVHTDPLLGDDAAIEPVNGLCPRLESYHVNTAQLNGVLHDTRHSLGLSCSLAHTAHDEAVDYNDNKENNGDRYRYQQCQWVHFADEVLQGYVWV